MEKQFKIYINDSSIDALDDKQSIDIKSKPIYNKAILNRLRNNSFKQPHHPNSILVDGFTQSDYFSKTFDNMDLNINLLRALYLQNYSEPTKLQQQAIYPIILNKDLLAISQSKTGKTVSIAISSIQKIDFDFQNEIKVIILAPTRDLCIHIANIITKLSSYISYIKPLAFIGGTSLKHDIKSLSEGVNIVIGTPSRILDMLNKKIIQINSNFKSLLIDDSEEMLSRGFVNHINTICTVLRTNYNNKSYLDTNINDNQNHSNTNTNKIDKYQIVLFSNKYSKEVINNLKEFMTNPLQINALSLELFSFEGTKQYYINVKNKLDVLLDLYKHIEITQAIIFVNSKSIMDSIYKELLKNGFSVSLYHSDMIQQEKDKHVNDFNSVYTRIFLTSDYCLNKNLNISQVEYLINYDLPDIKENYIKRIGISRRFSTKGVIINIINKELDEVNFSAIQNFYKIAIEEFPIKLL